VGTLRIMSRHGDDQTTWDYRRVLANDPEAVAEVEKAERAFSEALKEGATAFKVEAAIREAERIINEERQKGAAAFGIEAVKTVERINKFDRAAEEIIVIPRVVGG
jgi:hypothetical protein